jgi:hypothetical protein
MLTPSGSSFHNATSPINFFFKRKNCEVYAGDALFESAPRYRLSRRGITMVSIGFTKCRGGASNQPRTIPNPFNLSLIIYSAIRPHTLQYREGFVK